MQHVYAQSPFADDIILIVDTEEELQKLVIEWTHEVERKGMELNEKKSKVMKVNKGGEGNINIQCKGEMLEKSTVTHTSYSCKSRWQNRPRSYQ
jgi:ribosome-interacting GTPase 1